MDKGSILVVEDEWKLADEGKANPAREGRRQPAELFREIPWSFDIFDIID